MPAIGSPFPPLASQVFVKNIAYYTTTVWQNIPQV